MVFQLSNKNDTNFTETCFTMNNTWVLVGFFDDLEWQMRRELTYVLNNDILINLFTDRDLGNPKLMDEKNFTKVKEFILLGFTTELRLQRVLFFIFFIIYIISLLGNITLISLICADSRLHTPMYFFIGKLSFLDLWYSSVYASIQI